MNAQNATKKAEGTAPIETTKHILLDQWARVHPPTGGQRIGAGDDGRCCLKQEMQMPWPCSPASTSVCPCFPRGAPKGCPPLGRCLCFSGGSGAGRGENVDVCGSCPRGEEGERYTSSLVPHITSPFPFLTDAVVSEAGPRLQLSEAGMILQQETMTIFLNFYVRVPKGPAQGFVLPLQPAKMMG